ncbi:bestrophin family ion channel [Mesorhizobium sp. VK23B]|uniref:Bestrophin family ion channel n=1 Tax=Mesorhizobium dulcispinae TaxID=3072316 RepID=A0ABU4XJE9_9HYPH|nr:MULTISPECIES: bestrophin family ion channel [unclassified Mesorhizobium]MDX8467805.1 bestrophin family ion channel [Mesorhizobium sp. VK23B]MDX8474143.1 bestrophin family ion channel [Mesorhizobium sp. VK23A]MDX8518768.1 bestrophin family ion channel [Mesorhizobium sp. VK23D]
MIVRPRPGFLHLFFIMRGSVVPRILPQIFGFAAYGALVVLIVRGLKLEFGNAGTAPFALLGVALSIYLGFRNNAAYDRWWEARKLWGQLVFDIRNLARASTGLIEDRGELRGLLMDAVAFCHFLRGLLRRVDALQEARGFIGDEVEAVAKAANAPDALVRRMGARVAALRKSGAIDTIGYRILDERLSEIAAAQAGCERIMGTPLPFAYTLLLQRTAYVFCLLLPFGLASATGWATPLFTALIAYTFFGLDALSEELEDPFGTQPNDLALDGLCRVCEISVFEALGETPPKMIPADKFYFS